MRSSASVWFGRAYRHRHLRSVAHLLTGTTATIGISLLSVGLTARALGPADYGLLAIIITLAQASERLISFQSWQPIVRYGATLDLQSDRSAFRTLIKFGIALDLAGSITAWAVASILAIAAHFLFAVSVEHLLLALIFLLSLLFNLNGVSTAVFRLTDRFATIARLQVLNALIRLACIVLAYAASGNLMTFVLIWAGTQALSSLLGFAVAMHALRSLGITKVGDAALRGIESRFPGIWRFAWGANASLSLWATAQQVDTLLVGWLADPASAGMFYIAKRVSRVVQQVGSHVEAVVFPDLGRLAANRNWPRFTRTILQTETLLAVFGGACCLFIWLVGAPFLRLSAGEGFAAAAPLLSVQILATTLSISGAASRAGLLALGAQRAVLRTVTACTLVFYSTAVPLILHFGAMGANIAHLLFGVVWLSGLTISLRTAIGLAKRGQAATPH